MSLCACIKVLLGKDQGENHQYLLPTNVLAFGISTGWVPSGFCCSESHQGTPHIPGGFHELEISLSARPGLLLNHTGVSGDSVGDL